MRQALPKKLVRPCKLLKIMKLSFLFSFAVFIQLSAGSLAQQVTFNSQTLTYEELFDAIEAQTGLATLLSNQEIDVKEKVDIAKSTYELSDLLRLVTKDTDLTYELADGYIVIRPMNAREKAEQATAVQQEPDKKLVSLSGTISDEKGETLVGVSVYVDGTTIGVITDINGFYQLWLPPGENVLVIYSYIGMQNESYVFTGKTTVKDMVLTSDMALLGDVVVIGYGSKSKHNLSSSISSVKVDEIANNNTGANTIDNMLGGSIKGVQVTQNSGEPGAAASVNVRGITSPTSFSSNEPLYVIDGVPFFVQKDGLNPLLTISPNDIESIDVLKDAAATSIYGSRGANGVIIVNTKTGKRNEKMTVTADYTVTVANPIKEYKPLNVGEFKNVQNEIFSNTVRNYSPADLYFQFFTFDWETFTDKPISKLGNFTLNGDFWDPGFSIAYDGLNEDAFGKSNTNWDNDIKNENALSQQFNVGLRGGSSIINYNFSFNAADQEGLYINDKLERYGTRLSLDANPTEKFKVGTALNYSYSDRNSGEANYTEGNTKPWIVRPDLAVRDANGDFIRIDASAENFGDPITMANPVAEMNNNNRTEASQFIGNAYVEYYVIDKLKLRADANIASFQNKGNMFMPRASQADYSYYGIPLLSQLFRDHSNSFNSSINFRADYDWAIQEHQFSIMAGTGWDRQRFDGASFTFEGFPDDEILTDIGSAFNALTHFSSNSESGLNSVYSRLSYNYLNKYLAEVNFRTDASSKFGPGNKRGYFPSLSLGWRMKNEAFLVDVKAVDDLKLRLSGGQTGSTNLPDFAYIQFFSRTGNDRYGGLPGISISETLPNKNVKWEMTTEYNGGIDFSFFIRKLYGSIDVYHRYTDGALAPTPPPLESGMKNYTSNLVDVSNKGVELELASDVLQRGDLKWTSRLNLALNRNIVEDLNGAAINQYRVDLFTEGYPSGTLKGYVVEGIIQSQSEIDALNTIAQAKGHNYYQNSSTGIGDYKYKDIDGDGRVNRDDREVIATPEADFFGGFYNSLSYKNFNLAFMFQFSYGAEALYNGLSLDAFGSLEKSVHRESYNNTWTPENTNARYAQLAYFDPAQNARISDRYVFSTSYLRLKNINLSYDLPRNVISRLGMSSANVFVSATNLFTITDWPGIDPELTGSSSYGKGVENSDPYPLSKSFSMGVRMQF